LAIAKGLVPMSGTHTRRRTANCKSTVKSTKKRSKNSPLPCDSTTGSQPTGAIHTEPSCNKDDHRTTMNKTNATAFDETIKVSSSYTIDFAFSCIPPQRLQCISTIVFTLSYRVR
jgi:hypothetical protein